MADGTRQDDKEALLSRLRLLDEELQKKGAGSPKTPSEADIQAERDKRESADINRRALRIPADLFAGLLIGYFLGLGLDNMLETGKVFTMICLLLGVSGALWNIVKDFSPK